MLDSPKDCSSERLQFITNGKAFIADCPSAAQRYVTHLRRTGIDYMGLDLLTKCTDKMIVCVCVFADINIRNVFMRIVFINEEMWVGCDEMNVRKVCFYSTL